MADPSLHFPPSVKRWPVILTGIVDELASLNGSNPAGTDNERERLAEGKQLIQDISGLIYEMRHDRVLAPILGESFAVRCDDDPCDEN